MAVFLARFWGYLRVVYINTGRVDKTNADNSKVSGGWREEERRR